MNFSTYRKHRPNNMDCQLSTKISGKWAIGRSRACLSPLGIATLKRLSWEHGIKKPNVQAISVKTYISLRGTAAFRSMIDYFESAPQYEGSLRYDRRRKWLVCDSTTISPEALCHAFRNYLNMRERPGAAILFHALTSDGVDADAAFLVAMSFYTMRFNKDTGYSFEVGAPIGHNGVCAIPNNLEARKKHLREWKRQRPSGKSYLHKGYQHISAYSGSPQGNPWYKAGNVVPYAEIKQVALSYL